MSVTLRLPYQNYVKGQTVSLGAEVEASLITQGIAVAAPVHVITSSEVSLQHGVPVTADFPTAGGVVLDVDSNALFWRTTGTIQTFSGSGLTPDRFDRPPTVLDNTARGYGSTSVWQASGAIYTPVAAPDSTSAAWDRVESSTASAADIVGVANVHSSIGMTQRVQGFTGACIDINVVLATVTTTKTINILANNLLDEPSLAKWIQQADANTDVMIIKFYDQSGGTNHYIPDSGAIGFYVVWDPVLKRYAYTGEVSPGASGVYRDNPYMTCSTGTIVSNAHSIFVYGRGTNSQAAANAAIGAVGTYAVGTGSVVGFVTSSTGTFENARENAGTFASTPAAMPAALEITPCVVGQICDTTTVKHICNEETTTTTLSLGTYNCTGAWMGTTTIGAAYTGRSHNMAMVEIGRDVLTVVPTARQLQQIKNAGYKLLDAAPQLLDQVIVMGDSRAAGYGAHKSVTIASMLPAFMKERARIFNYATGSQTPAGARLTGGGVLAAVNKVKTGVKNVAIYTYGINAFLVDAKTPAAAMLDVVGGINDLKAAGYYVILLAEMATTAGSNNANTYVPQLRTLMLSAGSTAADVTVDVSTLTAVATPSSLLYYADGIHPTGATYEQIASALAPYVDIALRRAA